MELKVEIEFDTLLQVIKDLPESQKSIVKKELDAAVKNESNHDNAPDKKKMTHEEFKTFLLNGPVFDKYQLKEIKETRKQINKWRKI